MKILRLLSALWFAIVPFVILSAIGILAYLSLGGFSGLLLSLLFIFLACFSGFYVFKTAMQVGILKFISVNESSPELDNLLPTPSDNFQLVKLDEFVKLFEIEPTRFHGGTIAIWGDWQERDLEKINEISNIKYLEEDSNLIIDFENGNKLIISKPEIIFVGKAYLKIVKADKIEWQWDHVLEDYKYSIYKLNGKKIEKSSNIKWSSFKTFTSIAEPAVKINYRDNLQKKDVIIENLVEPLNNK